jgi:hypothetical protein
MKRSFENGIIPIFEVEEIKQEIREMVNRLDEVVDTSKNAS